MHGNIQESGLIEIIPLMCTSALWDQCPVFSHPESPQGALLGVVAMVKGLLAAMSFVCWYHRGHSSSTRFQKGLAFMWCGSFAPKGFKVADSFYFGFIHILSTSGQAFSGKGQIVNTSGFAGHRVSVATIQSCCKSSHRQLSGKKRAWLCSNKALFTDTEIWISHNFHMYWNTILLLSFFKHLKI